VPLVYKDDEWVHLQPVEGLTAEMKYTGLHEKHGKEIYEGDVVAEDNTAEDDPVHGFYIEPYEILWSDAKAGWLAVSATKFGFSLSKDGAKTLEVIGNIHENPELMK